MRFHKFTRPTGGCVLVPEHAEVLSITQEDSESYWVAFRLTGDQTKSFHVKGPLDQILATLEGEAYSAEEYDWQEEVREARRQADLTVSEASKELEIVRLSLATEAKRADYAEKEVGAARQQALQLEFELKRTLEAEEDETGGFRLWSTFRCEAGTIIGSSMHRLFSCCIGNSGQGFQRAMTLAETSCMEPGTVPGGTGALFTHLRIDLIGGTERDREKLIRSGAVVWDATQTAVRLAPISEFDVSASGHGRYLPLGTSNETLADVMAQEDKDAKVINALDGSEQPKPWTTVFTADGIYVPQGIRFGVYVGVGADSWTLEEELLVRITLIGRRDEVLFVG